jgi:hypothetical protein
MPQTRDNVGAVTAGGLFVFPEVDLIAYDGALPSILAGRANGVNWIKQSDGSLIAQLLGNDVDPTIAGLTARSATRDGAGFANVFIQAQSAAGTGFVGALLKDGTNPQVSATILDSGGQSTFLQLLATAKRKINFGFVNFNFVAVNNLTVNVAHGLGVAPIIALATPYWDGGVPTPPTVGVGPTIDATNLGLNMTFTAAQTKVFTMYWLAIG